METREAREGMTNLGKLLCKDVGYLRPWLNNKGESKISVKWDGPLGRISKPSEIPAKLTKVQWIEVDRAVARAFCAATPLTIWLRKQKLEWPIPEGIKQTVLTERVLPFTHHDGTIELKEGCPFDPIYVEASGRRVGEAVEKTLLGLDETQYHLSGLLNHPKTRQCKSISHAIVDLASIKYYGPYVVVHPLVANQDEMSQIEKEFMAIERIQDVIFSAIPEGTLIVFQATSDVIRLVVGLDLTVVQWEEGFKTVCIIVPEIREDFHGNVGIVKVSQ